MAANNSEEEDVDFNEESDLRDNVSEGVENENLDGEENSPSSPSAEEGENADDNASASDNNENSSTVGKKRVREASKESQLGDGDDTKPKQKKMGALTTSRSHTSKKSSSNGPAEIDRKAYRNPESNSKEERDSDRIQNVLFVSRYGHTKPIYERDIEDIFRPYGSFQRVTMKGPIAFVDFVNAEDAARAKKELHQTPALNSDSIIVDFKKHGEGRSDKNARSFRDDPPGRHDKNGGRGRDRDRDGFRDGPYRKPSDSYGSHFDDSNNHRSSGRDFPRDARDSDRRSGHYDNRRDSDYEPKYDDRGGYSRYNGPGGGKHNDSVRNHRPPFDDRDYPTAAHQRVPMPKGLPPPVNAYPPSNNNRNYPRDEYPPYDSGNNHRNAPYGAHPPGRGGPPPAGDYPRPFDGNPTRSKDRTDGFGYGPSRQGGPPPYNDSRPPVRGGGEGGGYPPGHIYGGGGGGGAGGYNKTPYDDHRRFGPPPNKFDGHQGAPYRGGGGGGGGRGGGF